MTKKWIKIGAVLCAAAMVLSFAACKKGNDQETTSTTAATSATTPGTTNADTSTTLAEGSSNSTTTTTVDGTTAAGNGNSGQSNTKFIQPKTKAEMIAAFNNGLSGKVTRTLLNRKMSKGMINAFGSDINLTEQKEVLGAVNCNLTSSVASSFNKLNAGDVSSATCTKSGSNYVLTFQLNKKSGGKSIALGDGGYNYFIDMKEGQVLINQILKNLKLGSATVKDVTVDLKDGKIVATMDQKTGKLKTIQFSCLEKVVAQAKWKGMFDIPATIEGAIKSNYSVA